MAEATVCTFNIRHGLGLDDRVDLERTSEVIARSGADLVALQELDRFHPRSDGVDQVAELERSTGLRLHFCPTVTGAGSEYGIALATRDQIEDLRFEELPRAGSEEPRRAIVATWRGVTVIATHLAHDPHANDLQEKALAGLAGRFDPRVLVIGDLNRTRRRFSALARTGLSAAVGRSGTIRPRWRMRQIDHVLVGRAIAVKTTRTLSTTASDHRPLVVLLRSSVEDVLRVTYDV